MACSTSGNTLHSPSKHGWLPVHLRRCLCTFATATAGSLQEMQPGEREYPTGPGRQMYCLLKRELLAITRNPFDQAGRYAGVASTCLTVPAVLLDGPAYAQLP
jgi:hypothetical protein